MNRIAANGMGSSSAGAKRHARFGVGVLLSLTLCGAWAFEEIPPAQLAAFAHESGDQRTAQPQFEVSAASLPNFGNVDGAARASRIDLTWLPPRHPELGVAMGMSLGMTNRTVPGVPAAGASFSGQPRLDLGFHWRYTMNSNYRIDFTAWHRMPAADAIDLVQSHEPTYGARVEMGLGSMPKRGLVADRGFIGFQLDGGARITLRRRGGTPMVYYRTSF